MKPVSLLLAQTGPKLGNKERNLRQISEQASKARKKNVDLLIFPELHLPTHSVFEERRYYRPGQEASVFKTDIGTIGLSICYDLYFPELTRLQALQGAELVVCISASPGLRRRFFEGFCLSRAMENAV